MNNPAASNGVSTGIFRIAPRDGELNLYPPCMEEKQIATKAPRHKVKCEAFNFYSSLRLGVLVANPPCPPADKRPYLSIVHSGRCMASETEIAASGRYGNRKTGDHVQQGNQCNNQKQGVAELFEHEKFTQADDKNYQG